MFQLEERYQIKKYFTYPNPHGMLHSFFQGRHRARKVKWAKRIFEEKIRIKTWVPSYEAEFLSDWNSNEKHFRSDKGQSYISNLNYTGTQAHKDTHTHYTSFRYYAFK